jgi:ribosomal-protein-alanine N-acetyltransferase
MPELFESFPYLKSEILILRKMTEENLDTLNEITGNEHVYRCIPLFLYKKSRRSLLTAIKNLGGRDFETKRIICAKNRTCLLVLPRFLTIR